MPKLPVVSAKDANKVLQRLGFTLISQKGSHAKFRKLTPDGKITCIVPQDDELAEGTLRSIIRQAKVTPEEFIAQL